VFYFVCVIIGLFCVIALGYGPLTFVLVGVALVVLGFRSRLQRWWGLALAAAGLALVASVLAGWSWRRVVAAFLGAFVVVAAARLAGRVLSRRAELPRP
jgi:lysylphosphatidylglycerol synthetase-like protein (DUF2156 family)